MSSKDKLEKTNKLEAALTETNKGMGKFTTGEIENMSKCLFYICSPLNSACLIKHMKTTTDISITISKSCAGLASYASSRTSYSCSLVIFSNYCNTVLLSYDTYNGIGRQ